MSTLSICKWVIISNNSTYIMIMYDITELKVLCSPQLAEVHWCRDFHEFLRSSRFEAKTTRSVRLHWSYLSAAEKIRQTRWTMLYPINGNRQRKHARDQNWRIVIDRYHGIRPIIHLLWGNMIVRGIRFIFSLRINSGTKLKLCQKVYL